MNTKSDRLKQKKIPVTFCGHLWIIALAFFLTSCEQIQSPKSEPFISQNQPPAKQELRWSNGKLPKSLDPARVSAAPESDVVRALYEGLTDVDPKTLEPIPAIATKWTASKDYKTWTFQLRQDAKWTNGKPVTAQDFVDSWKRLSELGDKVPQRSLLKNLVGMDSEDVLPIFADEPKDEPSRDDASGILQNQLNAENTNKTENLTPSKTESSNPNPPIKLKSKLRFGVEALSDYALKVSLIHPDREFSVLVAHPIFRPIYGDGKEFEKDGLFDGIVTNGAFRLISLAKDGIVLERSAEFWGKDSVRLKRIRFVPTDNAEQALAAYRAGQVDVVTNANFAPLALKLLKTYDDLKHSKHSALSFYEFNQDKKPFDDARVREALAIGIERERLTEDEMDGATKPALNFLPFSEENKLEQNLDKARKLLSDSGFPNGYDFPTVRLLVTRNDLQKRIANSVKKMWKKNLNIETEVIVKDKADFENSMLNGEFDIVRRGVVLPTNDETANMLAMFEERQIVVNPKETDKNETNSNTSNGILDEKVAEFPLDLSEIQDSNETQSETTVQTVRRSSQDVILTEAEALEKLPAIPLYFPVSYSLVKPYIQGFEVNALDAPSLKQVEIDDAWQPSNEKTISNSQD